MVIVFNLGGAIALVVAAATWIGAQTTGHEAHSLVGGFAAMAVLGGALELQRRPGLKPRLFWILPGWLVGTVGTGIALHDLGYPEAGYGVLGVTALGLVVLFVKELRKPGAPWFGGLIGALAVTSSFQVLGFVAPEHKHPVLYVLNAIAIVAAIFCGVKLYRARRAAA